MNSSGLSTELKTPQRQRTHGHERLFDQSDIAQIHIAFQPSEGEHSFRPHEQYRVEKDEYSFPTERQRGSPAGPGRREPQNKNHGADEDETGLDGRESHTQCRGRQIPEAPLASAAEE